MRAGSAFRGLPKGLLIFGLVSTLSVVAGKGLLHFDPVGGMAGLYRAVGMGCVQLGMAGVLVFGLLLLRHMVTKSVPTVSDFSWVLKVGFSMGVMLVTGEIFLRVVYWDGLSFQHHSGPMVRRFERDFSGNCFDGPSRGPEVLESKAVGSVRILIQGDSITWGQGVKDEEALYSNQLLGRLRQSNPEVGMAVLAMAGRDIDGHIEQLEKWGAAIQPDVILYQWFVNDIELDKTDRPAKKHLFWRSLFFHDLLREFSYLWFFMDDRLAEFWPFGSSLSYSDYLMQKYGEESQAWTDFEGLFREWAEIAKSLTPRVMVILYPSTPRSFDLGILHDQMTRLAAETGVEAVDLIVALPEFSEASFDLYAGPFDAHPSAVAHGRVAAVLNERLVQLWPEVVAGDTVE